jgi:hypothetical protein
VWAQKPVSGLRAELASRLWRFKVITGRIALETIKSYLVELLDTSMADENQGKEKEPSLADLITLSEASELSGLSPSHLRLLVSRGDIWGKKLGRNWFTTAQTVADYIKLDRKPGPKPQNSK